MARSLRHPILCLITLLSIAGGPVPNSAEAGCFSRFDFCVSCAQQVLGEGLPTLDIRLIRAADAMLWDCTIALYRCIVFDKVRGYPYAV